ncbi:MAG TPA: hypothetical protein VGF56_10470 [Rhizomicrobium sp.]
MTPARILAVYRWVFALLIAAASAQTLLTEGGANPHIAILAPVEIAAALLLLQRRSQVAGLMLLLAVLVAAQILTAVAGQYPMHFLQYAASAVLIVWMDRPYSRAAGGLPPQDRGL